MWKWILGIVGVLVLIVFLLVGLFFRSLYSNGTYHLMKALKQVTQAERTKDPKDADKAVATMREYLRRTDDEMEGHALVFGLALALERVSRLSDLYTNLLPKAPSPETEPLDFLYWYQAVNWFHVGAGGERMKAVEAAVARGDSKEAVANARAVVSHFEEAGRIRSEHAATVRPLIGKTKGFDEKDMNMVKAMEGGFMLLRSTAAAWRPFVIKLQDSRDWGPAYDSYLRGKHAYYTKKDKASAERFMLRAVQFRSDYGEAHLWLARLHLERKDYSSAARGAAAAVRWISPTAPNELHGNADLCRAHQLSARAYHGAAMGRTSSGRGRSWQDSQRLLRIAVGEIDKALAADPGCSGAAEFKRQIERMAPAARTRRSDRPRGRPVGAGR